jgi:hypothetical protein
MLRGITYQQFRDWQFFDELEPFGEKRQDYRFASIVQALSNIYLDKKKRSQPFTLGECVVRFGEQEEEKKEKKQSWQIMKEYAKIAAAAWNAPGKD